MGNRHGAETFTPRVINPAEHPGLHWTLEAGQPEYTPNVGSTMMLGFGRADTVQVGETSFEIGLIQKHSSHIVNLAPQINTLPPPQFWTDEQAKKAIEARMPYIHFFAERAQANIIVATHGRVWGLFPELYLAEAFIERGFKVPKVFPKVGGRNRIQEHAILLLGKPSEDLA